MSDVGTTKLEMLLEERRAAWARYVAHENPGGLTPADERAWHNEHIAFMLLLEAAHIRWEAESSLQTLIENELKAETP